MPKLPDDTIYIKHNNKYIPIGKRHNIDMVGYGCYFVECKKYSKGIRKIDALPDPDFIGLETAARMCIDDILKVYYETIKEKTMVSNYELIESIINGIKLAAKNNKQLLIDILKE